MELQVLGGELLPGWAGPEETAGAHRPRVRHGRGEWVLLFAALPEDLPCLVRADAPGLRVRGEGEPLHHAQQEASGRRDPARELLRVRCARARGQAGALPVAAVESGALRPGAAQVISFTAAAYERRS